MPKMLADEGTEYDDGTPASESQQAKDVTTFLSWCVLYRLTLDLMYQT
jgi:ubiquinol-cytochrome c reductase cytochrome c1 subunit